MSHLHRCYHCKNISSPPQKKVKNGFSLCRQIKLQGFISDQCYVFLSGIELIR